MWGRVTTVVATAALMVALGWSAGAYFPHQWGLLTMALVVAAVIGVLVTDAPTLGRHGAMLAGGLTGLALWQLSSAAWSPGPGAAVLELERTVVYVAAALAILLAVGRERAESLVIGIGAGAAAVTLGGLCDYLISASRTAGGRLADPVGYANAAGFLAGAGLIVAVAAASREPRWLRIGGAALVTPLAVALYLSLSRGAVLATVGGLAALVAASAPRGRMAAALSVLALPAAAGILLASRSGMLSEEADDELRRDGRRLAIAIVALAAASVAAIVVLPRLSGRIRRLAAMAAPTAGVLLVVAVLVHEGGPVAIVDRAVDSFRSEQPGGAETSPALDRRLLSASPNARASYWRVAWEMVEREPLTGEGGGSFERWWLQERTTVTYVRDAHNLYLETLAELGPVGLALLAVALSAPLFAFRRVRRHPVAAAALGVYVLFLLHAALDWDWEIPLLTLTGLGAGAALTALACEPCTADSRRRALLLAGLAPLLAVAFVAHVGNAALADSERALDHGDARAAVDHARRAHTWTPWSALAMQAEGEALLAAGADGAARRALARALELDPESWSIHYDIALLSAGGERRRLLAEARRLNPLEPDLAPEEG
jgi:O-antigen ligase/polysaccharide polymerase Wzy-like membrane protein